MNYQQKGSLAAVILLIIFCIFVFFCELNIHRNAQLRIDEHAHVIGNALWNYNPQAASKYLSLACKSQNYQYLTVTDTEGKLFQKSKGEETVWSEKLFIFFNLIPNVQLRSNITHEGKIIGQIEAVWYCHAVFIEVAVLLGLILIFFIFKLSFRLLHSNNILEDRVLKRTGELSILNDSLQSEVEKHQQAKAELSKSEERYRLITENSDDIIWTTDINFRFTYISPSVFQQRGFTVDEAMEQTIEEVLTPKSFKKIINLYDYKLKLIKANDSEGWKPIIFELEQYTKDGKIIWTHNNAIILPDPNKQPAGILGITRNITERKKAEEARINAQAIADEHEKLALVGEIAGKIAHDFNNILGAIMGNAELSLLDCRDTEIKKTLELIFKQTMRGKNLTKNLIAFAKDQEPKQELLRINDKINFVTNLLRKDLDGIEVINKESSDLPDLLADSGMIEHALLNLIQNSIHALSMAENPVIIIRTYFLNNNIYLEIEDNGCGIPEENIHQIYEPFFTLKGVKDISGSYKNDIKGTGYGMANIRKYIEQHHGDIAVESKLGAGTKFTIRLPVFEQQFSKEKKGTSQSYKIYIKKRILLVEDEEGISNLQYRILTQAPYYHTVDIAHNGKIAIALSNSNNYDFVSLDYVLPGNINGMDVYKHIRKINKTIPILFLSGNIEFIESIKKLKQEDAVIDHLSKPCQNKEYVTSINKLFEKTAS
ncbi:MAG: PAS domain S-box protein [Desulfobacteraceae bacterium]|nr:PAS domain S-box protein [Desulfobacteraceae bacterium]